MAEPIPFLAAGPEMAETYFALKLNVVDLDGDGRPELLADGNPGKIAVMRGGGPAISGKRAVRYARRQPRRGRRWCRRGGPISTATAGRICCWLTPRDI